MNSVPIPGRKPDPSSTESIFSFSGLFDGASSILSDVLEYRLLEKELDNQSQGVINPAPNTNNSLGVTSSGGGSLGFSSNQILIYGALVLGAVGVTAFVLD